MVENYDDMLSRFYLVPEHNGQTDGQTDGQNCYINIALQLRDVFISIVRGNSALSTFHS